MVAGSSGPGAGIAAALAADGARVAVLEPAPSAQESTSQPDGSLHRVACDFASAAAVRHGVTAAVEALGGIDQFVYAWYPDALTETTTFTNVSEEGVRLQLNGIDVIDEFVLLFSGDSPGRDGTYKVVWRQGRDVGAKYISSVIQNV